MIRNQLNLHEALQVGFSFGFNESAIMDTWNSATTPQDVQFAVWADHSHDPEDDEAEEEEEEDPDYNEEDEYPHDDEEAEDDEDDEQFLNNVELQRVLESFTRGVAESAQQHAAAAASASSASSQAAGASTATDDIPPLLDLTESENEEAE